MNFEEISRKFRSREKFRGYVYEINVGWQIYGNDVEISREILAKEIEEEREKKGEPWVASYVAME